MKKHYTQILIVGLLGALLFGCSRDPKKPHVEYAPQMYAPIAPESYTQLRANPFFKDKKNMQEPVPGTVARGKADYYYPYAANNDGYEKAGAELKNPLPYNKENVDEGKRLYQIYCQHCHGKTGKGDGPVAPKISTPPDYAGTRVKALTDGKMFHSITNGYNPYPSKGMGAHGSMLSPTERWKVIHYVKTLAGTAVTDSTKKDAKVDKDKAEKGTEKTEGKDGKKS